MRFMEPTSAERNQIMTYRWIVLWMAFAAVMGCNTESAIVRQTRKERLVNDIRRALLESVGAEKSAVLATTDEESKALAEQSQRFSAEINRLRGELRPLIIADNRPREVEKLDAFDATWAEVEAVDNRLLALAVANTNLKAAGLSAGEGAALLDRLVDTLMEMQLSATESETIRILSQAAVGALRVNSLLLVHIPEAADAEMTRLEQQMRALSDVVDSSLARAHENSQLSKEQLARASQAWSDYQRVVTEVLRLSRENSNVISFDVSIHEKRYATEKCVSALSELLGAVQWDSKATR